ncbi:hypothetical protein CFB40_25755 [Burkholderia sp. AU31652]|nr:hypothetical protein CFB40_25755 [Burkholderia sp. AU31652]OXJ09700.1 hypothetical protein CFB45_22095 [Burkholderia sp. HI2500]
MDWRAGRRFGGSRRVPMRTTDASRHSRCIGRDASLIACVTRVRRNAFVERLSLRERITASTHQPEQTAAMP